MRLWKNRDIPQPWSPEAASMSGDSILAGLSQAVNSASGYSSYVDSYDYIYTHYILYTVVIGYYLLVIIVGELSKVKYLLFCYLY